MLNSAIHVGVGILRLVSHGTRDEHRLFTVVRTVWASV